MEGGFESRKIKENLEWSIQDNMYLKIKIYFKCNFTTDLLVTLVNAKVDRYYAFYVQPYSEWTNAFSYN